VTGGGGLSSTQGISPLMASEDMFNLQFKVLGRKTSAKWRGRRGQWTAEQIRRRDCEREGGTSTQ